MQLLKFAFDNVVGVLPSFSLAQITRLERGIVNPTICTLKCLAKA
jgi:transcriptional regulator with XRE-family HTH domain